MKVRFPEAQTAPSALRMSLPMTSCCERPRTQWRSTLRAFAAAPSSNFMGTLGAMKSICVRTICVRVSGGQQRNGDIVLAPRLQLLADDGEAAQRYEGRLGASVY